MKRYLVLTTTNAGGGAVTSLPRRQGVYGIEHKMWGGGARALCLHAEMEQVHEATCNRGANHITTSTDSLHLFRHSRYVVDLERTCYIYGVRKYNPSENTNP